MTLDTIVIRLILVTIALSGCGPRGYVLPVADGDGPEPSQPALQGRITAVGGDQLVVAIDPSLGLPPSVAFQLGPRTELFTVYGGFVAVNELVVGQRVRVWFDNPGLPTHPRTSSAAVLILASTDPNDDWP